MAEGATESDGRMKTLSFKHSALAVAFVTDPGVFAPKKFLRGGRVGVMARRADHPIFPVPLGLGIAGADLLIVAGIAEPGFGLCQRLRQRGRVRIMAPCALVVQPWMDIGPPERQRIMAAEAKGAPFGHQSLGSSVWRKLQGLGVMGDLVTQLAAGLYGLVLVFRLGLVEMAVQTNRAALCIRSGGRFAPNGVPAYQQTGQNQAQPAEGRRPCFCGSIHTEQFSYGTLGRPETLPNSHSNQ